MLELYLHNLVTNQATFERLVIRKATFETQFGNKAGNIGRLHNYSRQATLVTRQVTRLHLGQPESKVQRYIKGRLRQGNKATFGTGSTRSKGDWTREVEQKES